MEEVEGLTENSEETIHEGAHEGPKWTSWVALSTALLATLAAISASLSGHNDTEVMLHQVKASDQWNYYESKGIKSKQDKTVVDLLTPWISSQKTPDPALVQKVAAYQTEIDRYEKEQEEIKDKASDFEKDCSIELKRHETFATGVTFFQVAIAISAISILTKRRRYWAVSLVFGAGGLFFLVSGLLQYLQH